MCGNNYAFLIFNILRFLRKMQSYSSLLSFTSVKECLPLTRVLLLQFPILSFFQFLTITDNKDVHYYLFYGEQVPQQKESAQMVEHSLRMREVVGAIHRFSNLYRACNSFLPKEEYVDTYRIF